MKPKISILVVCLNPGEKLHTTLESIYRQTYTDYEIIIKDGGSTDGTVSLVKERPGQKIVVEKDAGIYDAMNRAAELCSGEYVYFLNCGDTFADENVLSDVASFMEANQADKGIYYGNIFERLTGKTVTSNPNLNAFGCYRNVPCHQACFYARELVLSHPFETKYRVRADYEQFLWCFFEGGARTFFMNRLIADYEGGGFSETKENVKRSAAEHREIVQKYMSRGQILKYRLIMWITLAPLRTKIAQNEKTAGIYNGLKSFLYKVRK